MQRTRFWTAALFVLMLLTGYGAQASQGGATKNPTGKPIIIGGAIALTGGFSGYDLQLRVAAQVAVDDINKAGGVLGRPLKYVVGDTKSDRAVGAEVAADLLSKGAVALITQCDFDFGTPAALVAQRKKVPAFSCATSPRFGVQEIGPFAYNVGINVYEEAAAMAEWTHKNLKARTAYLLIDTTIAYDTDSCKAFEARWKKLPGARIVGKDTFQNDDPSISSQITKIRSLSEPPDLILPCTYLPGGVTAIRQIRQSGINSTIIVGLGIESTNWFKPIPNLSKVFMFGYASEFGDDPRPAVRAFFKKLKRKSGKSPQISITMAAYCEVQVIAGAIKRARSTNGDKMRRALDKFKNFPCIIGPVSYTPRKHYSGTYKISIVQITNSKAKFRALYVPKKVATPPR